MTSLPSRAAIAAAALAAVLTLSGCTAPQPDAQASSAQVVHLLDADGNELADGVVRGWSEDVFGSPAASDPTFSEAFVVPPGATTVVTFISPRGREADTTAWNASGWLGLTLDGILLPNLKLSGNTDAGPGSPSGTIAVATTGGDYSTGIAFLQDGKVIEADFIEVTVTGNAAPENATWTWTASE